MAALHFGLTQALMPFSFLVKLECLCFFGLRNLGIQHGMRHISLMHLANLTGNACLFISFVCVGGWCGAARQGGVGGGMGSSKRCDGPSHAHQAAGHAAVLVAMLWQRRGSALGRLLGQIPKRPRKVIIPGLHPHLTCTTSLHLSATATLSLFVNMHAGSSMVLVRSPKQCNWINRPLRVVSA